MIWARIPPEPEKPPRLIKIVWNYNADGAVNVVGTQILPEPLPIRSASGLGGSHAFRLPEQLCPNNFAPTTLPEQFCPHNFFRTTLPPQRCPTRHRPAKKPAKNAAPHRTAPNILAQQSPVDQPLPTFPASPCRSTSQRDTLGIAP